MKREPTTASILVRAHRLLDPELSELLPYHRATEAEWLTEVLLQSPLVDERQTAQHVVESVLDQDEDPLQGLFHLARSLIDFEEGLPLARDPALWHWAGGILDTDLLVAARFAWERRPGFFRDFVAALSWPSVLGFSGFLLEEVLSREIAETHSHLGGALPGNFYWIAAMSGFAHLPRFMKWSNDPERWPRRVEDARGARQSLFESLPHASPLSVLRIRTTEFSMDRDLPEETFVDPILAALLPDPLERSGYNPALGERYLLWTLLAEWLRGDLGKGNEYDATLHRYMSCRNSFLRHLMHNPGVRGLHRFRATFRRQHLLFADAMRGDRVNERRRRRAARAILNLERFRTRHALRYQFSDPTDAPWARDHGAGLQAKSSASTPWRPHRQIELRVTPFLSSLQPRVIYAYLEGIKDFLTHDWDAPPLKVGFIFHIHRGEDLERVRETARWQLTGLLGILDFIPELRPFVVGIDAAGDEMSTPPRELAEVFRMVRQHVRRQTPYPGRAPLRLRRTFHAGEDFRDLLTGLRHVAEAVELLGLEPGERIGHGLALAFEPGDWYGRRPRVYPKRSDHILDLLWGLNLATLSDPALELSPDAHLEYALRHRLENLIPPGRSLRRLRVALRHFHQLERFPSEVDLLRWLGLEEDDPPIEIRVEASYIEMTEALRKRVLKRVKHTEVVIEACPTSNMVISGLTSYRHLPYRNLSRFHLPDQSPEDPGILFSINSDDPGLFQTTVSNEYRLLGQALIEDGLPRRAVADWLDEARRVGLASCFIPPWSPPTRDELLAAIQSFDRFSAEPAEPYAVRWTELPNTWPNRVSQYRSPGARKTRRNRGR